MALVQVTIEIVDQLAAAIPEVRYAILSADQSVLHYNGITDVDGIIGPVALEESTDYSVNLAKSLVTFTFPETLSVGAGPAPINEVLTGTLNPIEEPTNPNLCRLQGTLVDLQGDPISGLEVVARSFMHQVVSAGLSIDASEVVTTDVDGIFTLDLLKGTVVSIAIQDTMIRLQFVVPNQSTLTLEDAFNLSKGDFTVMRG